MAYEAAVSSSSDKSHSIKSFGQKRRRLHGESHGFEGSILPHPQAIISWMDRRLR
jgi:hypothetical protein